MCGWVVCGWVGGWVGGWVWGERGGHWRRGGEELCSVAATEQIFFLPAGGQANGLFAYSLEGINELTVVASSSFYAMPSQSTKAEGLPDGPALRGYPHPAHHPPSVGVSPAAPAAHGMLMA